MAFHQSTLVCLDGQSTMDNDFNSTIEIINLTEDSTSCNYVNLNDGEDLQRVIQEATDALAVGEHVNVSSINVETSIVKDNVTLVNDIPDRLKRIHENEIAIESNKKRHRRAPRTRSGRISRPPSYRVRDYKRIDNCNDVEELNSSMDPDDRSDGGYTDYEKFSGDCDSEDQQPANEEGRLNSLNIGRTSVFGTDSSIGDCGAGLQRRTRSKDHKCFSCDKAYIGKAGLLRHLNCFPDHGSYTDVDNENDNIVAKINEMKSSPAVNFASNHVNKQNDHLIRATAARRKARLKALVKSCRDDELVEIVGPRLVKTISCWQFLLTRCRHRRTRYGSVMTNGGALVPNDHEDIVLEDFETELADIVKNAEQFARHHLGECTALVEHVGASYFNVTNERAARTMNIATGTYKVITEKEDIIEDIDNDDENEIDDPDSSVERCLNIERTGLTRSSPPAVDLLETSGWSLGDTDKTYSDAVIQGFEILDMLEQDSLSLGASTPLL